MSNPSDLVDTGPVTVGFESHKKSQSIFIWTGHYVCVYRYIYIVIFMGQSSTLIGNSLDIIEIEL